MIKTCFKRLHKIWFTGFRCLKKKKKRIFISKGGLLENEYARQTWKFTFSCVSSMTFWYLLLSKNTWCSLSDDHLSIDIKQKFLLLFSLFWLPFLFCFRLSFLPQEKKNVNFEIISGKETSNGNGKPLLGSSRWK